MSTKYRFGNSEIPHFITMTVVEWVNVFDRKEYKDLLVNAIYHTVNTKDISLNAFVIMSNHVHLIVKGNTEMVLLPKVIQELKSFTANEIYKDLIQNSTESRRNWMKWIFESQGQKSSSNSRFKFWRHENHPIESNNNKMINQRLNYVHNNPVKAGICYSPEDYIYSSASAYAGRESILPIEFV